MATPLGRRFVVGVTVAERGTLNESRGCIAVDVDDDDDDDVVAVVTDGFGWGSTGAGVCRVKLGRSAKRDKMLINNSVS